MPTLAVRTRRSVASIAGMAMVGASVSMLLVGPLTAPPAAAAAAPGTTQRASVHDQTNAQAPRGGLSSVISGDGNHVAFVSSSQLDNLDTQQAGQALDNVYVRDLRTGRTVMISRGLPPQRPNFGPEKLLDLGGPAKRVAQQTAEVAPNGRSFDPALSADGRYVAFVTNATNIVDSSTQKVVVCDRDPNGNGTFDEDQNGRRAYDCFRVNGERDGNSLSEPRLSDDAGHIVWMEQRFGDAVYSRFRTAVLASNNGISAPTTVQEVPADLGLNDIRLDDQFDPAISGDGKHILMHATYVDTGCDCDRRFHAIVSTDTSTSKVTRVDLDFGKPISNNITEFVMRPATSFDGTVIAFVAEQFTVVDDYGNLQSQFDEPNVYVVHVDYGRDPGKEVFDTDLVSRDNAGSLANGERPGLSADGRYVAFVTDSVRMHDGADGPPAPDGFTCIKPRPQVFEMAGRRMLSFAAALPPKRDAPRAVCQVVMRDLIIDQDRLTQEQSRLAGTLVSPNQASNAGNDSTVPSRGFSTAPSLSADGSRIAYDSAATDLVGADTNQATDVFVRTLQPTARAEAVDFGPVQIGETITRSAAVEHVGAGPLTIEEVTLAGPNAADFTLGAQTCQLEPLHQAGSCLISVTFAPSAAGERRATLRVSVQGGRVLTIDLIGTGTERPVPRGAEFSAGPDPLDFGPRLLLSAGPAATVTVTNQGGSPLRITSVTLVPPVGPADYAVTVNTCTGVDVPPGGQCQVTVVFSPTLPGDRSAVLQFDDNAAGGPHLVGLRGQANQPAIDVNPGVTPPGRVTTVSGKDFPPGKTVTVTFRTAVGSSTATVGSDGTFRASLLVFHKATPENRRITATVDGLPALFAEDDLLVVFPTVSPADFVVRG